jgi:hypothetical protein
MEDQSKELNPDIRELKYGKKEIKSLILYPLSIGDQFKVTNMITEIVQDLVMTESKGVAAITDLAFMTAVMKTIETNLEKVLSLITDIPEDECKKIIGEMTNIQFVTLVESVWVTDYEPSLKKGRTLFERGRSVFRSSGSLQDSSDITPNTDLKTSTEKLSNKVE